ncbi:MAG TPA: FUSC family protein [Acidimicrobiia bacterium]|nr:FUSC family protein [Acidimicrobiia bacterium]
MARRGHGWQLHDPGRVNLRKASRAALVATGLFALAVEVIGNAPLALFAAFGSFAALVFADFGGPLPRRFAAYLGLAGAGAVLVAVGTLLSNTTVAAAAVMLVVAFAAVFLAVLGGPWQAGRQAATLAFVLAVMVPAPAGQLGGRELGWLLGVIGAGVAAVLLWPARVRSRARRASAAAAVSVARLTRAVASGVDPADWARLRRDVVAAIGDLQHRAVDVVYRPAGAAAHDRALSGLVVGLLRCARFAVAMDPDYEYGSGSQLLARAVADVLDASARMLDGDVTAPIDLRALAGARRDQEALVERHAAERLARGDDPKVIVAHLHGTFDLRGLAVAAALVGANTALLVGRASAVDLPALDLPDLPLVDARSHRRETRELLIANFDLRSARFDNAVRTAVGLAAAVVVAKILALDHAFWVVLGTLSVLRSGVLGTGVSALEALAGTALGFAVATGVMNTVGTDRSTLWIVLPIAIFLSAYTPGAVHFVIGQASFTVFVVVLFNLLVPQGWETGLVRLENIAIGVSVSILAGALLWPRGAARTACASSAALLVATGRHLQTGVDRYVRRTDDRAVARTAAELVVARERADAAFEDLAHQTVGNRPPDTDWTAVLGLSSKMGLVADLMGWAAGRYGGTPTDATDVGELLAEEADELRTRLEADAAVVSGHDPAPGTPPLPPLPPPGLAGRLRAADDVHAAIATHLAAVPPNVDRVGPVLRAGWAHQWLELAADSLATAEGAIAHIGQLARRPWWR